MKESTVYQAIFREGFEEGRQEAYEEERKKGFEEGIVIGLKRILLRLGQRKFGVPNEPQSIRLETTMDPSTLDRWIERIAISESWQALFAD